MPQSSSEEVDVHTGSESEDDDSSSKNPHEPTAEQTASVAIRVQKALFEALPTHGAERLVDLLEFIAVQHSGSSFNPDNTAKALDIAAFVKKRPFAVSQTGVASLAKLARHALGSSDGKATSAEHQLWLLTSGALNTAAAAREFKGDVVALFEAVRSEASVRGRYLQRMFAQAAMQEHLENPEGPTQGLPAPDAIAALRRQFRHLGPCAIFLAGVTLFVAVVSGIVVMSESATGVVAALATQMLEEKPPSLEDFVPAGMPAADMPADTPAES